MSFHVAYLTGSHIHGTMRYENDATIRQSMTFSLAGLSLTSMGQSSITSHPSEFQYKICNETLSHDINHASYGIKKQYLMANTV